MFACFDCPTRPVIVKRRRKRDIYCIDIRRFQKRLIGAKAALNAMACSKLISFLRCSRRNPAHFDAWRLFGRCQEPVRHDPCRSQHAKANHGLSQSLESRILAGGLLRRRGGSGFRGHPARAAIFLPLFTTCPTALTRAEPPTVSERDAEVPMPNGILPVTPCTTSTISMGTPSASVS